MARISVQVGQRLWLVAEDPSETGTLQLKELSADGLETAKKLKQRHAVVVAREKSEAASVVRLAYHDIMDSDEPLVLVHKERM